MFLSTVICINSNFHNIKTFFPSRDDVTMSVMVKQTTKMIHKPNSVGLHY